MNNIEKLNNTKNICINVAQNMFGSNDLNFKRIHHCNHHIALYIKDELMKDNCKTYFEIGTHFGHSLSTMLQSNYKSKYLSVDLFDIGNTIANDCKVKDVEKIANDNRKKYNIYNYECKILKGNSYSQKIVDKVKEYFPNGIDLLFIDGDHRYNGVINDFNSYFNMVNSGGYILFDDYLPYKKPNNDDRDCPKAIKYLIELNKDKIKNIGLVKDLCESNKYKKIDLNYNSVYIIKKL